MCSWIPGRVKFSSPYRPWRGAFQIPATCARPQDDTKLSAPEKTQAQSLNSWQQHCMNAAVLLGIEYSQSPQCDTSTNIELRHSGTHGEMYLR